MKLYLVRHAEAESNHVDPTRPLTGFGRETVVRMAALLKENKMVDIDELRHSSKTRAIETAQLLVEGLDLSVPVEEVHYLHPLDDVDIAAGEAKKSSRSLMFVGHLPHLNKLASILLCGDKYGEAFSFHPCSILCLRRIALPSTGPTPTDFRWIVEWMLGPDLVNPRS